MAYRDPMGQIPVRPKGSTKCLHHKHKDVIYFCATCKILICSKCGISENHCKAHALHDISDVTAEKTEEIRTFLHNVERQELPKLKLELQSIDSKLKENSALLQDLCKKMKVQANKCKEEIDILTAEFVSLCNKMECTNAKLLRDYQTELQKMYDNLEHQTKECKHTLQKGTEVEVFDTAGELPDLDGQAMPELPAMETVELHPQETVSGLLKQALGLRETMHKLMEEPIILTKFTLPNKGKPPSGVYPTEREQAWIDNKRSAVLVDKFGNNVRELRLPVVMENMSIAPKTGHIWFACLEQNTIHEVSLSSTESIITKFRTDDKPRRLCITWGNRVLVGTNDKILLYTTLGVVLGTTTNTTSVAVIRPWKIVECPVTGNIAVGNEETINLDEDHSNSHVIVFDQDLNAKFVYRGEGIAGPKETTFAPGSFVYDHMGNLVIADYSRNTIELISGTGTYIKRLHTAKGYLQANLGMELDDILWALQVSSGTKKDEILRIKYCTN